jgi:hypothetical protein
MVWACEASALSALKGRSTPTRTEVRSAAKGGAWGIHSRSCVRRPLMAATREADNSPALAEMA